MHSSVPHEMNFESNAHSVTCTACIHFRNESREEKEFSCVYGAVVILHFTRLDPLNPKPISEDLPNALSQAAYWRL